MTGKASSFNDYASFFLDEQGKRSHGSFGRKKDTRFYTLMLVWHATACISQSAPFIFFLSEKKQDVYFEYFQIMNVLTTRWSWKNYVNLENVEIKVQGP